MYAGAIFLSSFLLFLVQPLIARLILPWFGGSAAVWTTCMLFFQMLLVAGYAYAHLLARVRARRQALLHSLLLAAALLMLPIMPDASWQPAGGAEPVTRILLVLGATVGLPYFLLASTGPLVQLWFSRARPGENPYRLFALSNLASLLALLGYPFAVEPLLGALEQVRAWSWAFAGFAFVCALAAWRTPAARRVAAPKAAAPIAKGRVAQWLILSATGSVLLLAVTNHLTQNVASVPLLWLAPLTLYLMTFIVAFEGTRIYRAELVWPLLVAALAGAGWLIADTALHYRLVLQLAVFLSVLFVGCLFCHGELYRLRPPAEQLTAFYLAVAAGGALGGLLVAVLAPLVFDGYYELGAGLAVLALLAALRFARHGGVPQAAALAALLGITACAAYDALRDREHVRLAERGFYGALHVTEYSAGEENHVRRLVHGTIMHGEQYMHGELRRLITAYYTPSSGIGAAIQSKRAQALRLGVIGLGTGTLAAYGRPGDLVRFYEIDPHVVEIARTQFTYLSDSAARVEIALGDARLSLEREPAQGFDVLAVDAFSSDAIPVHLITREALGVYLRHVKGDGIVAFHVSNRFLDLVPVVARLAREQGAHAVRIDDDPLEDDLSARANSDWVLVSRSAKALAAPALAERGAQPAEDRPAWRSWSDDYSNLVQILK
ncbi:MAG TPA: fused MFS/spermidine synthase [Burkholderiales bacterium]|nr:fused MFS/spermidine synthase [Burkholderiales bacterium]